MYGLTETNGRVMGSVTCGGDQRGCWGRLVLRQAIPPVGNQRRTGLPLELLVVLVALLGGAALPQSAAPRLIATFPTEDIGIGRVQFSPDGRTLAIEMRNGLVLWDVTARQVRANLDDLSVDDFAFTSE